MFFFLSPYTFHNNRAILYIYATDNKQNVNGIHACELYFYCSSIWKKLWYIYYVDFSIIRGEKEAVNIIKKNCTAATLIGTIGSLSFGNVINFYYKIFIIALVFDNATIYSFCNCVNEFSFKYYKIPARTINRLIYYF